MEFYEFSTLVGYDIIGMGSWNRVVNCKGHGIKDEELFEPKSVFEKKGAKVSVASTDRCEAEGMLGGKIIPDLSLTEIDIDNYDALVIAGGTGSREYLWEDEVLKNLVREACNKNRVVAAIYLSPVVLARAGILEGKEATVYPDKEAISELKRNGAIYVDKKVVDSGRIITASGPESAKEFAMKIWDKIEKGSNE